MRRFGILVFWATWPVSWLMLHRSHRARVLVVADGAALLVRHWHGSSDWSLPGGGIHRRETPVAAAARELAEETGIVADPAQLRDLGSTRALVRGISYTAHLFVLELAQPPKLRIQAFEIQAAMWQPLHDMSEQQVSVDVLRAVRRWRSTKADLV